MPDDIALAQNIVDRLNQTSEHRIFEVKNDSDILIGDTHLSKNGLDFEIVLKNVALGVWMSASNDDNEDIFSVTMHWVGEGSVNWTNPSPVAHPDESGGKWEYLGCDAIDSEPLKIEGGDPPDAILEFLSDLGTSRCTAIPGGVICSVDDGGYIVHVKRNSDNRVAAIKIKTYEDEGEDEVRVRMRTRTTAASRHCFPPKGLHNSQDGIIANSTTQRCLVKDRNCWRIVVYIHVLVV
ncbi:hypothetical protein BDZ89DRAFT_1065113 [Hymenopellis radicata]|nr:hypothetical protein BDZ89DRAFT_1065113 [Hymenopellis radicata]